MSDALSFSKVASLVEAAVYQSPPISALRRLFSLRKVMVSCSTRPYPVCSYANADFRGILPLKLQLATIRFEFRMQANQARSLAGNLEKMSPTKLMTWRIQGLEYMAHRAYVKSKIRRQESLENLSVVLNLLA